MNMVLSPCRLSHRKTNLLSSRKRANLIARIRACVWSLISKKSVLPRKIVRSVINTQLRMRVHAGKFLGREMTQNKNGVTIIAVCMRLKLLITSSNYELCKILWIHFGCDYGMVKVWLINLVEVSKQTCCQRHSTVSEKTVQKSTMPCFDQSFQVRASLMVPPGLLRA